VELKCNWAIISGSSFPAAAARARWRRGRSGGLRREVEEPPSWRRHRPRRLLLLFSVQSCATRDLSIVRLTGSIWKCEVSKIVKRWTIKKKTYTVPWSRTFIERLICQTEVISNTFIPRIYTCSNQDVLTYRKQREYWVCYEYVALNISTDYKFRMPSTHTHGKTKCSKQISSSMCK